MEFNGLYSTKSFSDIYGSVDTFVSDYGTLGLPKTISDDNYKVLYYLLFAKYGNSPIANWDETQFKIKLQSIIWQYGPTWETKLDIQDKLRNLDEDDLLKGTAAIYNHAMNPGELNSETIADDITQLKYIDNQNTTNYKKSKMDAYTQLWEVLVTDVTESFINRFKNLFQIVAVPNFPGFASETEQ